MPPRFSGLTHSPLYRAACSAPFAFSPRSRRSRRASDAGGNLWVLPLLDSPGVKHPTTSRSGVGSRSRGITTNMRCGSVYLPLQSSTSVYICVYIIAGLWIENEEKSRYYYA